MEKVFPNLKLEHLRAFREAKILAVFGYRTCIFMNMELSILCKFLDANRNEKYYCGEFYENKSEKFCSKNRYFFIIAGESGVIKILDLEDGSIAGYLSGHTGAICDIKVFDHYVVSSGEDSSIRIWDLITLECVMVCGGIFGHKDHVLSVDVLYNNRLLVSSGTDCAIKQWKISKDKPFVYEPFTSFSNIHRCPIVKVKYYGDMIISLSNNTISIIYNKILEIDPSFNIKQNDPIFIGNIEVFNNCKTFDVVGHIFVGISVTGDVYLFDLRNIVEEKSPFLVCTGINYVEDFAIIDDCLYISSGNKIHRSKIDFTHFDDLR